MTKLYTNNFSATRAQSVRLLQTSALVLVLSAGQGLAQSTSSDNFATTGFSIVVDNATIAGAPALPEAISNNQSAGSLGEDAQNPASEWFRMGIADLTAGIRTGGAGNEAARYFNGRLAFYVKGKTAGGWEITSSLDTGDGPITEIFARLDDKDPRRVLDRLRSDANDLYPTYGDDSSYFDETPTAGRVYLRAENENFRITWGDFTAGINSASLLHNTRDLYGAEFRYQSSATTSGGEAKLAASLYAAQPDTLAQRDILRGTGGSAYFLTHQDINNGSLTLSIEVVDKVTGRLISSRALQAGTDYSVDHVQGVLLLNSPLTSSATSAGVVSNGGDEYDVNLVALYEYTPTNTVVDDLALGARGEAWLGDNLRVGATTIQESTALGDQRISSADARLKIGNASYAELEVAQSSGPGFGRSSSTDGGLTIISSAGIPTNGSNAVHFDSRFQMQDLGMQSDGSIGIYYESKEAGFSTVTEDITVNQSLVGIEAELALGAGITLGMDAEQFQRDNGDRNNEAEVRVAVALSDKVSIEGGVQLTDRTTIGSPSETGTRTDAGVRLNFTPSSDSLYYVFGQTTLDVSGGLSSNNRAGIGFDTKIGDKLSLSGELSDGDTGTGAALRIGYAATEDNTVYIGYTLDPTRAGAGSAFSDNGKVVIGGSYRLSETITTYSESVYDMPGNQRSLTQIYGANYTPSSKWTLSSTVEMGSVADDISGDFDRMALSFGTAYNGEDQSWRAHLEYRDEDGLGVARDRTTWGLTAGYSNNVSENWRLLGDVDALVSQSGESDFRDGEYVKASLGYAYRPVGNEKLNVLFGYTYLNDQPGEDQVSANGAVDGPRQISNIFSINAGYDLSSQLSISGKLGYRQARVAPRGTTAFTDNTAGLAVLRADWHVVNDWDVMGEGRLLYTLESDTYESGVLAAVYRHLGQNLKLGIGYEWGSVSDNLANIEYSGQDIFLNIVAKY